MNRSLAFVLLSAALALPAAAQQKADEHAEHHPATTASAAAGATDLTDGEIRKVDKEGGKLTIKHGEIKNLDMPAMTMVFQVKDAALLDPLKAGDKVRFRAERDGGRYVITAVEVAR